jgi:ABC-type hemin transport system substrate-binding protein
MPRVTTAFAPDFVVIMRRALDAASDRVPVMSRTPATKAKMAQRIVRLAHEGITDAHELVAAAVDEGMVPAL